MNESKVVKGDFKQEIFNTVNENVRALEALFPSVVRDGQVDFEALKEELGQFEEVGPEKYGLTWAGKQNAKKIAQEDIIGKTLRFVPEDSKYIDTADNLYIEGDNLEVLKLLRQNYYGSIKMIYIDPPYNTGNDFIYKDNYSLNTEESELEEGNINEWGDRYIINQKSSNRYHAQWLSMMYPRLKIAKDLLKDDGIIFISIDDNQVHDLKKICDEIYGERSFVTTIHVQLSTVQGQKVRAAKEGNIVKNAEYILVYSKDGNKTIGKKCLYDAAKYDSHYNKYLEIESEKKYREIALTDKIACNQKLMNQLYHIGLISTTDTKLSNNKPIKCQMNLESL